MTNCDMSHLWLHQDEHLLGITLSMDRFEDKHASSGLFKSKEGYYTSFIHCLKDLIFIINSEEIKNSLNIEDKYPYIEVYEQKANPILHIGQETHVVLDFISDSNHLVSTIRKTFGSKFYKAVRKALSKNKEFMKEIRPAIILDDPKGLKYASVYNNFIEMMQFSAKYISREDWLDTILWYGLYADEEVFIKIRTDFHFCKYDTVKVDIYTYDLPDKEE